MTAVDTTLPLTQLLPPSLRHREVEIDGARHHYVDCGSGPPILLIHGWSGSWENFIRWLPVLEPHFRVLIPDLPGCNGAPLLRTRHGTAALAAFLHELLAAAEARDVWISGLCFGANIGMEMARRRPDGVAGLLLHTPLFHPRVTGPILRRQVRLFTHPLVYPAVRRFRFNRIGTRLYGMYKRRLIEGDNVLTEDNLVNEKNMRVADRQAARDLAVEAIDQDFTAFLQSWRKPLFVIAATNDVFIRFPDFLWIKELAPSCRIALLEQSGHGWTSDFIKRQEIALREFVDFALRQPATVSAT
jgi:pimeloyl-ACP methyl ester carboxylesterase